MEFHVGNLAIHIVHYLNRYSYPFPANNAGTCLHGYLLIYFVRCGT